MKQTVEFEAVAVAEVSHNLKKLGISGQIRTALRKEKGLVEVNGEAVFLNFICKEGDKITIHIPEKQKENTPRYDVLIDIVYEDEWLAIVNKPSGLASISSKKHYGKSLENALASVWGDFVYHPINRLDKDTSGLMAVAKTQYAHSVLGADIKAVERKYIGIVEGEWHGEGVIDQPLGLADGSVIVREVRVDGKKAVTHYKVLRTTEKYSVVEFELKTGRTHQIRAHCKAMGHPLLGDDLYGGGTTLIKRQALHSFWLSFIHPKTGQKVEFEVGLPADMKMVLEETVL